MRNVVCSFLVLVAGCSVERAAPRPHTVTVGVAERSIAGDTSSYTVTYVLDRAPRTTLNGGPDTVRVLLRRDSTSINVQFLSFGTKLRFLQRDTSSFKVPKVFGFAAKYTACVQVRKTVVIVPNKCQSWNTNLAAKPDTTPPGSVDSIIVDSVMAVLVRPEQYSNTRADWEAVGVYGVDTVTKALFGKTGTKLAWTCPTGGTGKCPQTQFCAFVRLSSGAVAMTATSATIPYCQTAFDQIPGHLPTYTPVRYRGQRAPPLELKIADGPRGSYVAAVRFNHKSLERARNGDWVDPSNAPLIKLVHQR